MDRGLFMRRHETSAGWSAQFRRRKSRAKRGPHVHLVAIGGEGDAIVHPGPIAGGKHTGGAIVQVQAAEGAGAVGP